MGANISSLPTCLAAVVAFMTYTYTYIRRRNPFLSQLRGPKSHSFWIGNEGDIYYQNEVGDCEFEWVQQFGSAWRRRGCLGEDHLMVADPKALQHILHSSGYNFPKRRDVVKVTEMVAGRGLVCAHGEVHERQRKISAPVFFTSRLKMFIPTFQEASSKLVQRWKDELATLDPSIPLLINVAPWISRTTLDIMGQAGFDLHFGALDGAETELSKIIDSTLYPSPLNLIFKSTWRYIPEFLLRYVRYLPTREYRRFRTYLDCARDFSREIIKKNAEKGDGSDMMSVLLHTNASEDPQNRMRHEEVVDQLSALLLAGQETTASTLTWFLWEIARHPESQERIREEVAAMYKRTGASGAGLSAADLDSMAYTQAALKESMRLHPIIWMLSRVAGQDDAIPLAFPKGTLIDIALHAYQRLPEVWGEDAGEWNPDRFLEPDNVKQASIAGGPQGCIGWRFAVFEMLVIVTTLVKHFEFSLPPEREGEKTPRICRKPTVLMMPMAEGQVGPWMGLVVKPLN
ncbi:cytochrome P450 [Lactarius hatsudake]|nr:cytochrome P450 [Lactarius hatsudake]